MFTDSVVNLCLLIGVVPVDNVFLNAFENLSSGESRTSMTVNVGEINSEKSTPFFGSQLTTNLPIHTQDLPLIPPNSKESMSKNMPVPLYDSTPISTIPKSPIPTLPKPPKPPKVIRKIPMKTDTGLFNTNTILNKH